MQSRCKQNYGIRTRFTRADKNSASQTKNIKKYILLFTSACLSFNQKLENKYCFDLLKVRG